MLAQPYNYIHQTIYRRKKEAKPIINIIDEAHNISNSIREIYSFDVSMESLFIMKRTELKDKCYEVFDENLERILKSNIHFESIAVPKSNINETCRNEGYSILNKLFTHLIITLYTNFMLRDDNLIRRTLSE
jgi:hypothetical protein